MCLSRFVWWMHSAWEQKWIALTSGRCLHCTATIPCKTSDLLLYASPCRTTSETNQFYEQIIRLMPNGGAIYTLQQVMPIPYFTLFYVTRPALTKFYLCLNAFSNPLYLGSRRHGDAIRGCIHTHSSLNILSDVYVWWPPYSISYIAHFPLPSITDLQRCVCVCMETK